MAGTSVATADSFAPDPVVEDAPIPGFKQQWERFCQGIIAGKSQAVAYSDAGYTNQHPDVAASRMMRYEKIQLRLAQLRRTYAKTVGHDTTSLVRELEENRQACLTSNAPGGATAATMGKAKILGLIDKPTESNKGMQLNVRNLPVEQQQTFMEMLRIVLLPPIETSNAIDASPRGNTALGVQL